MSPCAAAAACAPRFCGRALYIPASDSFDEGGLHLAGATIPLDAVRKAACLAGKVTEIGIRPEDVHLVEPGGDAVLAGEIYVVEPMGNETLVDLRVGDQRLIVRARRGFTAPIGSSIGAIFEPSDASFFDATGSTVVHRAPGKGGIK